MKYLIAFVLFFGIVCSAKPNDFKVPNDFEQFLSQNPKAEFTIKMARLASNFISDSDDMNCTQCQIVVDNVCSLMTGANTYESYLFAIAVADQFSIISAKLNYSLQYDPNTVVSIMFPLIDVMFWPYMCQVIDSSCPVNPNPMCRGQYLPTDPPTTAVYTDSPAATTIKTDDCQDSGTGCEDSLDKCGNSLYKPFMCKHCKKTCNLCNDLQCSTFD